LGFVLFRTVLPDFPGWFFLHLVNIDRADRSESIEEPAACTRDGVRVGIESLLVIVPILWRLRCAHSRFERARRLLLRRAAFPFEIAYRGRFVVAIVIRLTRITCRDAE
jgi:hypothetical protein